MHKELRPEQIDILVGSPAVNDEFSKKIKELDRRLQANGMQYRQWDTLNDRQHDIFSHDMFLDGECATSMNNYVMGAVSSCGCPDTEEDLHHHSPVLMREIEKQQEMLPDMTVKIGEGLQYINNLIDNTLVEFLGVPDKETAQFFGSEEYNELLDKLDSLGNPKSPEELYDNVSKVALKELEKYFGKGWIDNTAEEWKIDGKKIKNPTLEKEGNLGRMWRLTNAGNRANRNEALEKIREALDDGAYGADIQVVKDEEGDIYKKGFLVRLSMVFKFPTADGKVVDVPWKMDLSEGMGAGGTAEGRQLSEFQQALQEAIEKNNGQPVTIEFPNGLGTVSGVANIISGPKRKTKGRVGDPKTDFVLQDKSGNSLYFLSAKDGNKPSNFNQWGGFSNIPGEAMKEINDFAKAAANFILYDRRDAKTDGDPLRYYEWQKQGGENVLKRMNPGSVPYGMVITKPIKNRMLKLKAVFGEDFGTVNPQTKKANHGLDYVNATFQIPEGAALTLKEKTEGDPSVLVPDGFVHVFGPAQFSGYPSMTDMSDEEIDEEIDNVMGRGYHPILLLRRAEGGRGEGVSGKMFGPRSGTKKFSKRKEAEAAAQSAVDAAAGIQISMPKDIYGPKVPYSMQSVRFGIFPAENRAITHVMNDNFQVEAVWDKEGALASAQCGSWYCNKAALDAVGGAVEIKEDGSRTPLDLTGPVDDDTIGGADGNPKPPSAQKFNKFKLPAANIKR